MCSAGRRQPRMAFAVGLELRLNRRRLHRSGVRASPCVRSRASRCRIRHDSALPRLRRRTIQGLGGFLRSARAEFKPYVTQMRAGCRTGASVLQWTLSHHHHLILLDGKPVGAVGCLEARRSALPDLHLLPEAQGAGWRTVVNQLFRWPMPADCRSWQDPQDQQHLQKTLRKTRCWISEEGADRIFFVAYPPREQLRSRRQVASMASLRCLPALR